MYVYKCTLCVSVCLYVHMYCLRNPLTVPPAIPHFKEVIVMALTCDTCGYRSNEVKSGAGVSAKGTRITLHLTDPSDLSRDILKVRRVTQWNLSSQTTHLWTCLVRPLTCETCLVRPLACETCLVRPLAYETCLVRPLTCETCLVRPLTCETCLVRPLTCETCLVRPLTCETCLVRPLTCKTCLDRPFT